MQLQEGGKFHPKLNTGERPIVDKYREGKMKRTLKREVIVLEIVVEEVLGMECVVWSFESTPRSRGVACVVFGVVEGAALFFPQHPTTTSDQGNANGRVRFGVWRACVSVVDVCMSAHKCTRVGGTWRVRFYFARHQQMTRHAPPRKHTHRARQQIQPINPS
jgi:hypothetical protein